MGVTIAVTIGWGQPEASSPPGSQWPPLLSLVTVQQAQSGHLLSLGLYLLGTLCLFALRMAAAHPTVR